MSARRSRQATTGEPESEVLHAAGHLDPSGPQEAQEPSLVSTTDAWGAAAAAAGSGGALMNGSGGDGDVVMEGDGDTPEQYSSGEEDEEEEDEFQYVDDDEVEEEEDEEEDEGVLSGEGIMSLLFGRGRSVLAAQDVFRGLPRLPLPPQPLRGDLAAALNNATRGYDIGQANRIWPCLDSSCDAMALPPLSTKQHTKQQQQQPHFTRVYPPPDTDTNSSSRIVMQQQQQKDRSVSADGASEGVSLGRGSGVGGFFTSLLQQAAAAPATGNGSTHGVTTRSGRRRAASDSAAAAAPAGDEAAVAAAAGGGSSSSSPVSGCVSVHRLINSACLLFKREVALGRQYGFSRTQQTHMQCARTFPLYPQKVRDHMHSRAYIGQYSPSGEFFIAAFQDRRVRLYDTSRHWALRKDVTTRMTRWTITDTTMSPDQRLLVYSSISPVAFVVNVGSSYDVVESQANITEVHEPLAFDGRYAQGGDRYRGDGSDDDGDWGGGIGIWSIAWSPQGGQLIAGTNGNAVYIYDIASKRCLTKLTNHQDDVNAVAYLREGDPHLIVSGSDDHMVRVWDVRDRSGTLRAPQGVLVGHTEGLTHVCPKGDGFHLISNCKDQTIKLWDTRAAMSASSAAEAARRRPRIPRWDYRWEHYAAEGYAVQHPDDCSLMTYRGHCVLQTLIRAYFSPEHTTGQRYIYAGNADGDIMIWDVVSGQQVASLQHHTSLVRDCSWHPYEPELTTASWDGRIISWGVQPPTQPLGRYAA